MDVMRPWLIKEKCLVVCESKSKKNTPVPKWIDDDPAEEEEWQWETPDLSEGGEWFLAQVASLKEAIKEAPNPEELYEGGLKALAIH
jgi:hypothetical protein